MYFVHFFGGMTDNGDKTSSGSVSSQQVRVGHVMRGYHRLQQDDTNLQPVTSDSDRASRSGSLSDELDLDSDISQCFIL